jgi:hypothetical protein
LFDDIRARQVVSALLHQFLEDHALAIADEIIGVCAAPAIFPFLSTVIKMTSSAISPRDVLIGRAGGFIKPSSDLPTKPLVRPLRIRRNIGTSACRNGSFFETRRAPDSAAFSAVRFALHAIPCARDDADPGKSGA